MKNSLLKVILASLLVLSSFLDASAQRIKLSWSKTQEDSIKGYNVYRKLQGDWDFQLIAKVPANDTVYFDNQLFFNTRIFYAVTAINNKNEESSFSRLADIFISDRFAPFGAFEIQVKRDDVYLTWQVWQKTRFWSFEIYRGKDNRKYLEKIAAVAYAPVLVDYRLRFIDRKLAKGNYFYKIVTRGKNGTVFSSEIKRVETANPVSFYLEQNYPNPFNSMTKIKFGLGQRVHVKIAILDLKGREVKKLVDDILRAGRHEIYWDGRDSHNRECSSGTYLVKMRVGNEVVAKKITFLK